MTILFIVSHQMKISHRERSSAAVVVVIVVLPLRSYAS